MALSIFSYIYWTSVCPLWGSVSIAAFFLVLKIIVSPKPGKYIFFYFLMKGWFTFYLFINNSLVTDISLCELGYKVHFSCIAIYCISTIYHTFLLLYNLIFAINQFIVYLWAYVCILSFLINLLMYMPIPHSNVLAFEASMSDRLCPQVLYFNRSFIVLHWLFLAIYISI